MHYVDYSSIIALNHGLPPDEVVFGKISYQ
jgi:hypothetical protein